MRKVRRSGALVLFGAIAVAAYFMVAPRFPKDQSVNVVLGDAAHDVTDVKIHYGAKDQEWARDVSLHYERGSAPRIIHHEARLPDGEYVIAIDLAASDAMHWSDEKHVQLHGGGATSIDVSERARAAFHGVSR